MRPSRGMGAIDKAKQPGFKKGGIVSPTPSPVEPSKKPLDPSKKPIWLGGGK